MPPGSKVLGDRTVRGEKPLCMAGGFECLHAIFSLACGAMGVLTPVVEVTTLPVFHPRQDLPFRRAVALQLIRNEHPWHVLEPLEQLTKELLRRLLGAATLHQDVEHVIVLIHGAPQVMTLPVNRQKDLVQVPLVPWLGPSTLQLIGVVLPKFQTPLADGLVRHIDAALQQELLHVAVAQREAIIEPDAMANDLAKEAVVFVACGGSGWRHVWLPMEYMHGS